MKRPPIGAKVEMGGRKGVVINRAYTTPEVQVRWESGLITWEDPRRLKWEE